MCIQDIAIGRRLYYQSQLMIPGTTYTLTPNPMRVAIVLGANTIGDVTNVAYLSQQDLDGGRPIAGIIRSNSAASGTMGPMSVMLSGPEWAPIVQGKLMLKCTQLSAIYAEVFMADDLANEVRQLLNAERSEFRRK